MQHLNSAMCCFAPPPRRDYGAFQKIVVAKLLKGTIIVTQEIIGAAIDCSILHRLNYWDALMIAAAEAASCSMLWTEDMQSGSTVRGVAVINPL